MAIEKVKSGLTAVTIAQVSERHQGQNRVRRRCMPKLTLKEAGMK